MKWPPKSSAFYRQARDFHIIESILLREATFLRECRAWYFSGRYRAFVFSDREIKNGALPRLGLRPDSPFMLLDDTRHALRLEVTAPRGRIRTMNRYHVLESVGRAVLLVPIVIIVLTFSLSAAVFAQTDAPPQHDVNTIEGTVRDSAGQGIAGASVDRKS